MTSEHLTPAEVQQQSIPVDVLKPQMDALIEKLRGKLAQSPEFQRALVDNYLYGQGVNLEEVEFQRGNHYYFVYLQGEPEETDAESEAYSNCGVGPYTGWKTLRIQRSPSEGYRPGYVYNEYLEMHISPHEGEYNKTKIRYNNCGKKEEINTPLSLEKAEEIIDSF